MALELAPKADAWHRWFYANRDPERTGLVAILHPWEAGRDNSIDWDEPLARVPTEGVQPYRRRDTQHVDAAERPTQAQYDRYMWLVTRFRDLGWDNSKLHAASPFQVVDPGFNAILIRSDEALAKLAETIGLDDIARLPAGARRGRAQGLRQRCGAMRPASSSASTASPASSSRATRSAACCRSSPASATPTAWSPPSGAGARTRRSASPRTIPPIRASSRGATGADRSG